MHNKYAIIDDEYVITGSFNWTQHAIISNNENLIII
jgi:cardiolipin hydrolase